MGNHSAAVLRNKGICITINETVQPEEGGPWEVSRTDKGEARTAKAWVRFDGNTLADLEDAYGDLKVYQAATGTNPFKTVRRTLSIVFGWDDLHAPDDTGGKLCSGCRRAGLAMREGGVSEYSTAIGAALALANGLDPTHVVKLIEQGEKATREAEIARDAALDEMLAEAEAETAKATEEAASLISKAGSASGSQPAAATTSSGG